jgi:hypothetical protein
MLALSDGVSISECNLLIIDKYVKPGLQEQQKMVSFLHPSKNELLVCFFFKKLIHFFLLV